MIRKKPRHSHASAYEQPPYEFRDNLNSADSGLRFNARVRIVWQYVPGQPQSYGSPELAAYAIHPQLTKTGEYSVLRVDAARQAVQATLARALPIRLDGIEILHATVSLQVDDETLAAARRLDEARRELELDALARRQVKARLEFLRTVCLSDPGTAKLFALVESSPRVGGPPDDATWDELVRTVHAWQPESRWIELARLLHEFLRDLRHPEQTELLHLMRTAVRTLGRTELADQIATLTPDVMTESQPAVRRNEAIGQDGAAG